MALYCVDQDSESGAHARGLKDLLWNTEWLSLSGAL